MLDGVVDLLDQVANALIAQTEDHLSSDHRLNEQCRPHEDGIRTLCLPSTREKNPRPCRWGPSHIDHVRSYSSIVHRHESGTASGTCDRRSPPPFGRPVAGSASGWPRRKHRGSNSHNSWLLRRRDEITSFFAAKRLWLCCVRFGGVAGQPVRGSVAASERAAAPVVAGRRSPRAGPGWGWNRGAGGGRGRRHGSAWAHRAPGAVDFVLPSLAQARWWT